jgi:hypothetical protein
MKPLKFLGVSFLAGCMITVSAMPASAQSYGHGRGNGHAQQTNDRHYNGHDRHRDRNYRGDRHRDRDYRGNGHREYRGNGHRDRDYRNNNRRHDNYSRHNNNRYYGYNNSNRHYGYNNYNQRHYGQRQYNNRYYNNNRGYNYSYNNYNYRNYRPSHNYYQPRYHWNPRTPVLYSPSFGYRPNYQPYYRVGSRFHNHGRHRINDYHRYGLYAPPSGHYWVRHNNDAYLAAVGTGIVAGIIVGAILAD